MNKRKYLIQYWYNTDLRDEAEVEARNEVSAMIIANEQRDWRIDWCDNDVTNFRITIKRAP